MGNRLKKNVPVLRFPEFKGSWTEKKLSEISNKISDGIHSTPKYDENGEYYFINGNNLINSRIEFDENTKRIDVSEYLKYKSDLTSQTILVSINGTIGNLSFYGNEKIILGKSACYINLKSEENKFFAFYLLQTSSIKNHFNKELTGSTIKNLSLTTIKNTKSLFPSEKEQEKIASFLGAVDTRISQLRRKHKLLQTYKRGVMQKIFSQQIRFKSNDGKSFPDWEKKDFGDIVSKVSSKYDPCSDEVSYPCVELESIASNEGRLIKVFNSKDQQSIKNKFKSKDVLFGKLRPYLRKFILADFDGVCSTEIWVFRGKRISSNYLYYLIQASKFSKLSNITFGSKMPRSDWDFISSFPFELPCKQEQEKIAEFLTAIDQKIEAVAKQIELTEQFKKGLLQKMFV